MDEDKVRALVKEGAKEALQEFLLILGTDASKPEGILDLQKDFMYTRESRLGKDEIIKKGKLALIGAFVSAVLAVFIKGLLTYRGP